MFNPMTSPQVNSYGEPCCLRPLPSQGVPSMGTEGKNIYQSLGLEDLADVSPSSRIPPTPSLPHASFLSTGGFCDPCYVCLESGVISYVGSEDKPCIHHSNAWLQLSLFSRTFWSALLPPSQFYVRVPGLWVCQRDQQLH